MPRRSGAPESQRWCDTLVSKFPFVYMNMCTQCMCMHMHMCAHAQVHVKG